MTLSPTTLSRAAGLAAVASGLLFMGVQIGHPALDATSITTTEMLVRDCVKVLMAALALLGVTGMYLRQVRQTGVLGLVGYLLLTAGYLLVACTAFVAAFVLPSVAGTATPYVNDVLEAATKGSTDGDIGHLGAVIKLQGIAYLGGGLLLGVAMFRARVLARWACVLLAVGGVVSAALSLMPDAFFRLLAFPNGIAMVALGWSLWRVGRTPAEVPAAVPAAGPVRTTAAAE
jgi:hypothetical protein